MTVTIGKEAYDDFKRYQRDKEANSQIYQKITPQGVVKIPSSAIRVGDVIKLEKNERVPADMVLLRTTEKSGSIFIRTDQLDGETDWKLRVAVPSCQKLHDDGDLFYQDLSIYADRPHKDIYSFIGTLSRYNGGRNESEPLNLENVIWMNTVVASGTAVGCVIYTGRHTRAVMNTSSPKTKIGLLDQELNNITKILCLFTFMLAIVMIALTHFRGPWIVYFVRFVILFSSIIPLSLRVNLDIGKTVYSFQIMRDAKIPNVIVRTSTIPEELGRIEYLLSDKTGTLTKNGKFIDLHGRYGNEKDSHGHYGLWTGL